MSRKLMLVGGILLALILALALGFAAFAKKAAEGTKVFEALRIGPVDPSRLADGKYPGDFDVFPIRVRLEVEVKDGKLAAITLLEHRNGKGKPAEALLPRIIEAQSLDLPPVSGATYSSKALQKAVEKALTGN